jgi:hypothetical protein
VSAIARKYAERGVDDGLAAQADWRKRRLAAERRLLVKILAAQRVKAKVLLRLAQRYLPLREVSKAAFLMALDVARFAARRHGAGLVRTGGLARADDVFAFTLDEVLRGLAGDAEIADVADWRQAKRAAYQALSVPNSWEGNPESDAAATGTRVRIGGAVLSGFLGHRQVRPAAISAIGPAGDQAVFRGQHLRHPHRNAHQQLAGALMLPWCPAWAVQMKRIEGRTSPLTYTRRPIRTRRVLRWTTSPPKSSDSSANARPTWCDVNCLRLLAIRQRCKRSFSRYLQARWRMQPR